MRSTIRRPVAPVLAALTVACVALAGCSGDDSVGTASDTASTGTTGATATGTTTSTTEGTSTTTTAGSETSSMTSSTTEPTSTTAESTGPTTSSTTEPTTSSTTEPTTSSTTEPTSTTDGTTDGTTTGGVCEEGAVVCEDGVAKVCDGMGGFSEEETCDNECADGLGCVLCVPGDGMCDGDDVLVCNQQGDAWEPGPTCDGLQGMSCDADLGQCVGACANLGLTYQGCDYYAVVTQQNDAYNTAPKDEFAIAVANTADEAAAITVTRGANTVTTVDVPANSVQVIKLPWINELTKGKGPTVKVADGAYRVRSTQPVTVYQFNPLNATVTNDASLLFPVNTWGLDYMAASWDHWNTYPAWYAVVASEDGTTVNLTPSASGNSIQAGAGLPANGNGQVTLDQGDVLQVISDDSDITGTIVNADKPVAMLAGHDCTNIPHNITACDHLEDSMFPIDGLGKEYIVVPPVQVPNNTLDKAQMIKIVASEPNTTLTFEPDQPVNKTLTNAGDFVQLDMSQASFKVSSDKKILVAQFMVGQSAGFGTSDPAMVLAVPTDQYRDNYLFFAATNWVANFVDIIAPTGAAVEVDQQAVNSWKPIGNTGYSVGHVNLSNNGDGTHRVTANQKVGISVYGVMSAGSYWFPGGLDLDVLPQ
ncbi:MAG: IgGFc-binding protein [Nannocystaceae bacterium]